MITLASIYLCCQMTKVLKVPKCVSGATYIYIYIYVFIYLYFYIHIFIYLYIYIYIHIRLLVIWVFIHVFIYIVRSHGCQMVPKVPAPLVPRFLLVNIWSCSPLVLFVQAAAAERKRGKRGKKGKNLIIVMKMEEKIKSIWKT